MKKYAIYSTETFKSGDYVWFSDIQFYPSGRVKVYVKPAQVKITKVYPDRIELDLMKVNGGGYGYFYRFNYVYHIRSLDDTYYGGPYSQQVDLGLHVSKTEEESSEKFNYMIECAIERKYQEYKKFEMQLKLRII